MTAHPPPSPPEPPLLQSPPSTPSEAPPGLPDPSLRSQSPSPTASEHEHELTDASQSFHPPSLPPIEPPPGLPDPPEQLQPSSGNASEHNHELAHGSQCFHIPLHPPIEPPPGLPEPFDGLQPSPTHASEHNHGLTHESELLHRSHDAADAPPSPVADASACSRAMKQESQLPFEQNNEEFLWSSYWKSADRLEKAVARIRLVLTGMAKSLGIFGEVKVYGSFVNGFRFGSSDVDVVFLADQASIDVGSVAILSKLSQKLSSCGFDNITQIFQANVPLIKFTDIKSGVEVDFSINNWLGVRNSLLLKAYCDYDSRVLLLGKLVKEWAKARELVGSQDGCLNSYAYMLLVIYFLQQLDDPLVPNLQTMMENAHPITDWKRGCEDVWETGFYEHVDRLPRSNNKQRVEQLLFAFFEFYSQKFSWKDHAVSMRHAKAGSTVDKQDLIISAAEEQWCIEDPFDLKHNLSGSCTRTGRKRILDEMCRAFDLIKSGSFLEALSKKNKDTFYMKCRISQGLKPEMILETFQSFNLITLYFPHSTAGHAFLEFDDAQSHRRAHTKNETYIEDCQLQLHYSTRSHLEEQIDSHYSTYDMASYTWKLAALRAREEAGRNEQSPPPDDESFALEAQKASATVPRDHAPGGIVVPADHASGLIAFGPGAIAAIGDAQNGIVLEATLRALEDLSRQRATFDQQLNQAREQHGLRNVGGGPGAEATAELNRARNAAFLSGPSVPQMARSPLYPMPVSPGGPINSGISAGVSAPRNVGGGASAGVDVLQAICTDGCDVCFTPYLPGQRYCRVCGHSLWQQRDPQGQQKMVPINRHALHSSMGQINTNATRVAPKHDANRKPLPVSAKDHIIASLCLASQSAGLTVNQMVEQLVQEESTPLQPPKISPAPPPLPPPFIDDWIEFDLDIDCAVGKTLLSPEQAEGARKLLAIVPIQRRTSTRSVITLDLSLQLPPAVLDQALELMRHDDNVDVD